MSKPSSRLGRGLGSLIAGGAGTPSAASSAPATASVEEVNPALVVREQNARPSSSQISEAKEQGESLGRGLAQRSCSQPSPTAQGD